MNCETVRRQLSLYVYGELSFEDEELVAQHLDGCPECQQELGREKRLHCALDMAEARPTAALLERCRLDLSRSLRHEEPAWNPGRGWLEWLKTVFTPPTGLTAAWMKPAGAVALIAVGFMGARLMETTPVADGPAPIAASPVTMEPVATQVRYVEPSQSGGVRIVVDETRQKVFSGNLEDESIQQLLLAAMRNPSDPGVRAESVELLNQQSDSQEVRNALLFTLENDPNDGVRMKALEGLRSYSADAQTRQTLSRVLLRDKNPGIRSVAIDLLVQSDGRDVVETLQQVMQREENDYIRLRGQQALRAMNASVESF